MALAAQFLFAAVRSPEFFCKRNEVSYTKKVQSLDHSIKTLHFRLLFSSYNYFVLFGSCVSRKIINSIISVSVFPSLLNLYIRFNISLPVIYSSSPILSPPFQVVLYHSAKPLFNYQSAFYRWLYK